MYRKSFIIKKEDLFKYIESEFISKVEIANSYNKTLRDKSLCKIYVYFKIPHEELMSIFSKCKIEVEKIKNPTDHSFLNGIQSLKGEGFISEKLLNKLIDIEKRNGISLSISGKIKSMHKMRIVV